LRACRSQTLCLFLPFFFRPPFFFRHARKARASLCALVNDRRFTTVPDDAGATLPTPENVALGVAPKISGCGVGAALHESPDVHGGGATGSCTHGELTEQTCAS